MCLIMPAFSSPELEAFPLHLCHFRSCGSAPSLPNLPRAGKARQWDLFRSAFAPLHKSHRLARTRFSVGALVILSECLCQWRKDPYLPSQPLFVRHLPRTNVLACSMFVPAFRHCFAAPIVSPDHPSGERNSRSSGSATLTVISRPKPLIG